MRRSTTCRRSMRHCSAVAVVIISTRPASCRRWTTIFRRKRSVRLAVSNLAWGPELQAPALEMLARMGVDGVEVAPTRIAGWAEITPALLREFRSDLAAAGLRTSSLQAIYYGCPDAQLLGDASGFAAMCEHTRRVAGIALELGAGVASVGAPRHLTRLYPPADQARNLA